MSQMSQEKMVLYMLRGVIDEAPAEDKQKIGEAAEKIRVVIAEYGDNGKIAVALVGAEITAE